MNIESWSTRPAPKHVGIRGEPTRPGPILKRPTHKALVVVVEHPAISLKHWDVDGVREVAHGADHRRQERDPRRQDGVSEKFDGTWRD